MRDCCVSFAVALYLPDFNRVLLSPYHSSSHHHSTNQPNMADSNNPSLGQLLTRGRMIERFLLNLGEKASIANAQILALEAELARARNRYAIIEQTTKNLDRTLAIVMARATDTAVVTAQDAVAPGSAPTASAMDAGDEEVTPRKPGGRKWVRSAVRN